MANIRDHWFVSVGDPEQGRIDRMLARADQTLAQLESVTATPAIWNARTAAQRQEDTRLAIVMLTKLSRLILGRLEAE